MPVDLDALERLRRLRSLGVHRGARDLARPEPRSSSQPASPDGPPGEPVDTPFGPAWLRTIRFPLESRAGLATFLGVAPPVLAALGASHTLQALVPGQAAFVDTETTGLSLGTGTYTFLIGIGTYEPAPDCDPAAPCGEAAPSFVVRQYFMRHPGEERAQLYLAEEALGRCSGLVTFNGRAFDVPLLTNRFVLHHLPPPLPGAPHLDLLPPARRLWRARLGSCALASLERNVLSVHRTSSDVPGWMIPGIYHDFYRNPRDPGAAAMMDRVFYHNLEDIVSMALLAGRMALLFDRDGLAERLAELHPLECSSLARCYETLQWHEAGEMAYRVALAGWLPDDQRAGVLHDFGLMLKRAGRRSEAAELWESWITSVPADGFGDVTPYLELAKHHEWHTGDLAAARGWSVWAMRIVQQWGPGAQRDETLSDLQRRLDRLERKLSGPNPASAPAEPVRSDESAPVVDTIEVGEDEFP